MENNGWIKIHRQIQKHWIWDNPDYLKAWIAILITVNHEDNKVLIHGELFNCGRGESLLSLANWAKTFGKGWTIQRTRTFFNLLEKDKMITTEGCRKTTRLNVCNYDSYQEVQQTNNRQTTDKQQADNKQITTNKNDKKNNNIYTHENVEQSSTCEIEKDEKKEKGIEINYQSLIDLFNKEFEGLLPKVVKLTDSRKKAIKARIAENSKEDVIKVFKNVKSSAFLLGKEKDWACNFDWIFNSSNFVKILEGNYNKNNDVKSNCYD